MAVLRDDVGMAAVHHVAYHDEAIINEPRGETLARKLATIMYSYGREICIVLVVVFTTFTAFQNSPLKTRKAKSPERFFPWNSLVSDYYMGNVQSALERMRESDLSFVFYYAPWDASCMAARKEFDALADIYHDEVLFIAINCWWPEGECKIQFPKVRSFPILMAYPSSGRGIQYHGRLNRDLMMAFLNHVITPVTVIYSPKEMVQLRVQRSSVVVAFFNFNESPQPPGYVSFIMAALLHLEEDPVKEVAFAVVPNLKVAQEFGVNLSKTMRYYLWNSTETYPSDKIFSAYNIISWVKAHRVSVLQWINPPGRKSLLLSNIVSKSSTLILTTPRMSLMPVPSSYFKMLQEVVLDYHDCNATQSTRELIEEARIQRKTSRTKAKQLRDECRRMERELDSAVGYGLKGTNKDHTMTNCCHTVPPSDNIPSTVPISCDICGSWPCARPWVRNPDPIFMELSPVVSEEANCKDVFSWEHAFQQLSVCCFPRGWRRKDPETQTRVSEGQDVAYLKRHNLVRKCKLMDMALAHESHGMLAGSWWEHESDERATTKGNFTGLACKTNRTLAFIAMDAVEYGSFAEKVGVDVSGVKTRTSAIIFDGKSETIHVLKKKVSATSLREFIQNYTSGTVDRFLRSSIPPVENCKNVNPDEICIVDVTADTFQDIVLDEKKEVVLLVYAHWCVFCSGMAHIYMAAANYFRSAKGILFTRLNGDTDDLPWEFTVEKYPTILLFPALRKSESVAFPPGLPITLPNVIRFVLSNIGKHLQVELALQACGAKCVANNRRQTLVRIHDLLGQVRVWQSRHQKALEMLEASPRDENVLDYLTYTRTTLRNVKRRLRLLKELHFTLGATKGEKLSKCEIARIASSQSAFEKGEPRR